MSRRRIPYFLAQGLLVFCLLTPGGVAGAKLPEPEFLFVSPEGDDSGDGSAAHPFATLERAREAVRVLKLAVGMPSGGITVSVGPGHYPRRSSFVLGPQDGGREGAPVVWKAASPGAVVLDAGVRVRVSEFQRPAAEDLRRMEGGAVGKVVSLDLVSLGVQHAGPYPVSFDNGGGLLELYFEGEVVVQSYTPFHPAIQFARHHDFTGFYDQEIEWREKMGQPPFTHFVLITVRSPHQQRAQLSIETLHRRLKEVLPKGVTLGEPSPAPLEKSHGNFRFHLALRTRAVLKLSRALRTVLDKLTWPEDVFVVVDVDAHHLL